ncbi:MAG: nitroreductase family protein [Anaerolineaceae bacterium]
MNQKMGLVKTVRSLVRILQGKPAIPTSLSDNQLLKTVLNRRSVRSFTPENIPEDVFAAILEAARVAPSTVNLQTWAFAVFDNDLWLATFGHSIPFRASRAVIVLTDTCRVRQVLDVFPYSPLVEHTVAVMNASLAAMNMNIAAEALGVSSVMLSETGRSGLLDAGYLKEKLSLPDGVIPLMTIVFGYAAGPKPPMPPKLPASQIFFGEKYKAPVMEVMEDWLAQMKAGYKASHLRSSFENQIGVYKNKISQAENDLHNMIYNQEGR